MNYNDYKNAPLWSCCAGEQLSRDMIADFIWILQCQGEEAARKQQRACNQYPANFVILELP